jgi:hypothetical protein
MNSISLIKNQLVNVAVTTSESSLGPLTPVTVDEVLGAFKKDSVFREYFDSTHSGLQAKENDRWALDLTVAINDKIADLPKSHTGCELIFRFRKAYGDVNHVALATVWRGQNGGLNIGFAHQESIPRGKENRGRVFDTFDSRAEFNGKTPPVLQSMLKYGLPNVAVRTCSSPENVRMAASLSDESCEHPYGFDGKADSEGFHALTCFSVTQAVHNAVQGKLTEMNTAPTVPQVFKELMNDIFGGETFDKYRYFTHNGTKFDLENLSQGQLVKGFLSVGKSWGDLEWWDVSPASQATPPSKTASMRPKF